MQPASRGRCEPNFGTFSILGRIGGDATTTNEPYTNPEVPPFQYPRSDRRRCNFATAFKAVDEMFRLSVSSVGSEAMQLPPAHRLPCTAPLFQYPRSDRRRCNAGDRRRIVHQQPAFQYPRSDRRRCNWSIPAANSCRRVTFQYPRSDRRRCNLPVQESRDDSQQYFQYPRSDRRRCNLPVQESRDDSQQYFQYPRSDRRRCNKERCARWSGNCRLSVSSVGSEAMQLFCRYGSPMLISAFSILGRIGGDATNLGHPGRLAKTTFQYPRSDRRRCNWTAPSAPFALVELSVSSVGSEAMQQPTIVPSNK